MVVDFPKKKKETRRDIPKEIADTLYCDILLDELIKAQTAVDICRKADREYWTGARDWLKNMVMNEMLRNGPSKLTEGYIEL